MTWIAKDNLIFSSQLFSKHYKFLINEEVGHFGAENMQVGVRRPDHTPDSAVLLN